MQSDSKSGGDASSALAERWNNKALFSLIGPLIIEQILTVTMGAADTIMVSSIGEFAISGVNIIDNINNLLIIAFTALATGGAVVVSQYIGRQDRQNASLAARQLVYISSAVSLLILGIVLPLRRFITWLFYGSIDPEIMDAASVYFLITGISYPFLAVYNACAALFRAVGNSRITMYVSLLVNGMNIAGNAFFIFVLKLGVAGAAFATLLSRIAAAAVLFGLLLRKRDYPITLAGLRTVKLVRSTLRSILTVGIPSALESSMFQIGRLLTQRIFTGFGAAAFAGNAVAGVINAFSFMPGMAYGMALLTVVGQCVGAGDYRGAKRYTARIMKVTYLTIFLVNFSIYIGMDPLIGLFSLSPAAHDMAKLFLKVHCVFMVIGWGMSFALPNALRAAGDARFVMIAASVSMWTVRVSAAYFLTYVLKIGPISVWLAMGGDFLVRGACYLIRWRGGKWQEKRVI
jgi:putative MATE family efflux protein